MPAANSESSKKRRIAARVEKDSIRQAIVSHPESASDHALIIQEAWRVGEADLRPEVIPIRCVDLVHGSNLSVDKSVRTEEQVTLLTGLIVKGRKILPAQAQIDRQVRQEFPVVLDEQREVVT